MLLFFIVLWSSNGSTMVKLVLVIENIAFPKTMVFPLMH